MTKQLQEFIYGSEDFKEKSEKLAQSIEINSVLLSDSSTEKAGQRNTALGRLCSNLRRKWLSCGCIFFKGLCCVPSGLFYRKDCHVRETVMVIGKYRTMQHRKGGSDERDHLYQGDLPGDRA